MPERKDKIGFIQRHKVEITPTARDLDLVDMINQGSTNGISDERINSALEKAETKLFRIDTPNKSLNAKRVLLTTNDPGSWNAIGKILKALEHDPRCSGITVLASGLAEVGLENQFGNRLLQIREKTGLLEDLLEEVEERPCEIVIASVSSLNGPETVALYGGKSNFGAKKIFYIFEGWGSVGPAFENKVHMDSIDGIFCNDELAKRILHQKLPHFPQEKIYVTGTPGLESLEIERADELRTITKEKLGISSDTKTILYLGDISADYGQMGPYAINEKTFTETFDAICELAQREPEKQFAFALRTHPRDPNKNTLFSYATSKVLPQNLTFKDASSPHTMNEVAYAADVIVSIGSTENFFAPLRGKPSIFLGYEGDGMGKEILEHNYDSNTLEEIGSKVGTKIASSPSESASILSDIFKSSIRMSPAIGVHDCAIQILNDIFDHTNEAQI